MEAGKDENKEEASRSQQEISVALSTVLVLFVLSKKKMFDSNYSVGGVHVG